MTTAIDHRIEVPGGKLFAREWIPADLSSQPSLLLLHDSLGCVELWRDFPLQLAEVTRRRVIAYDRLGFGKSDARTDRLSLRFVAEEAEICLPPLLKHFHVERFIPFGHSVGGGMAVCSAVALADKCEALILESAQMFAEDRTLQGVRDAKEDFLRDPTLPRLRKYHGDKARWVLDAWTESWLDPSFAAWHLRTELPRIRCPVLAIHGSLDEYGSAKHPQLIKDLAGGPVTMRLLEGVGHVPHREQPGLILDVVNGFLSERARSQTS